MAKVVRPLNGQLNWRSRNVRVGKKNDIFINMTYVNCDAGGIRSVKKQSRKNGHR